MTDDVQYEEALSNGHSYNWDERWEEAISAFESAKRECPDKPAPYAGLGMAYFSLGQYDDALENYQMAARYSQGDVIYLRQVADIQERQGQANQAAQTYLATGEIQLRRHSAEQAVDNWSRAIRLDPNLLRAHQRLARYYAGRQGAIPMAMDEFLEIARIFQANGDLERALRTCQLALKLDKHNPDIVAASERLQQGLPLEVATSALSPVDMSPSETIVPALDVSGADTGIAEGEDDHTNNLVQDARLRATERLAKQIFSDSTLDAEDTTTEAQLSKLELDALISQALDYQSRQLVNEAISCYERAIAGGVARGAAHFNLGLLYQEKSRFGEAILEFSASVREQDFRLASHFTLGESYRARGQVNEALDQLFVVLESLDLASVPPDQADRMKDLYRKLRSWIVADNSHDRAIMLIDAAIAFLNQPNWQERIREARSRLNALSGARMMVLGEIFVAGSAKVFESLYLSQEYEHLGLLQAAIEEAYRAIAYSEDFLPAHIRLGELLAAQGRTEAAAEKYVVIGDAFLTRDDPGDAINMYEQACELAPRETSNRLQLIELLRRRGEIDRALEQYVALGESYCQLAQFGSARGAYQTALKLLPQSSAEIKWRTRFLQLMAEIDMQRSEWHRALAIYRELRHEDSTNEQFALTLLDLYLKVEQPNLALRELDLFLEQLVDAGQEEKVPAVLEEIAGRHPESIGLSKRLAQLYLVQGQRAKAIAELERLGELQLEAGHTDEAAASMALIIQLDPGHLASYHQFRQQLKVTS